jgi:alpha 1,2-mannosyltransferase
MNFWRSPAYQAFFEHLDAAGGFYYERWGDAPVHSIAAALFLPKENLHFFNEIGYRHDPFQHCPQGELHVAGRCSCNPEDNFDYQGSASCMDSWDQLWATKTGLLFR